MPTTVSPPPRRARPDTPHRTDSGSPATRATTIAIEYATTPPAATAALVCAGPDRKTALQVIVADSTNIEQNVRKAGRASAPPGHAKCAVSTAASSALGRRRGVNANAATTTPIATAGNCTCTPIDAAAAPAAIADPTSRPKLHAPCSAERTGRPSRRSTATPCAFAATSTMLKPAPSAHAAGTIDANDGANASAEIAAATTRRPSRIGPRL